MKTPFIFTFINSVFPQAVEKSGLSENVFPQVFGKPLGKVSPLPASLDTANVSRPVEFTEPFEKIPDLEKTGKTPVIFLSGLFRESSNFSVFSPRTDRENLLAGAPKPPACAGKTGPISSEERRSGSYQGKSSSARFHPGFTGDPGRRKNEKTFPKAFRFPTEGCRSRPRAFSGKNWKIPSDAHEPEPGGNIIIVAKIGFPGSFFQFQGPPHPALRFSENPTPPTAAATDFNLSIFSIFSGVRNESIF